jgi:SAM-dependent methyltransferase
MSQKMHATEQLSLEEAKTKLPIKEAHLHTILTRLGALRSFEAGAALLDIGSAQGCFLIAAARRGWKASGLEPWDEARAVATRLAEQEGVGVEVVAGVAESLPWPDQHFDVVLANSVMEHVLDANRVMQEAYRVLKPGGIFWFSSASSLCPRQGEIRGFPLFGWYPDSLKLRIMDWARRRKPHLIGYTDRPAIHWFTPRKARRMLRQAGFSRVYDRWDLRQPSEGQGLYRILLRLIRWGWPTKWIADVIVPESSYAAVK